MKKTILKDFHPEIMQDGRKAANWLITFLKGDEKFIKALDKLEKELEERRALLFPDLSPNSVQTMIRLELRAQDILRAMINLRLRHLQECWMYGIRERIEGKYSELDSFESKVKKSCRDLEFMVLAVKEQNKFIGETLESVSLIVKKEILVYLV